MIIGGFTSLMLACLGLLPLSRVYFGNEIPIGGVFWSKRPPDAKRSCLTWAELTNLRYRRWTPVDPD